MKQKSWEQCVDFHGHVCGGLTIGYQAARYAIDLLELTFSDDAQVVCITENDACGVDAIQVMLGCSIGKGNLLFHMTGKQAFSFYNRKTGKSVRLVLKRDVAENREKIIGMRDADPAAMFDVKETTIQLPAHAKIFQSIACDCCGETTADHFIRLQGGKQLCLDCWDAYNRLDV